MRRLALIAALTATASFALEDWIRVWPNRGRAAASLLI